MRRRWVAVRDRSTPIHPPTMAFPRDEKNWGCANRTASAPVHLITMNRLIKFSLLFSAVVSFPGFASAFGPPSSAKSDCTARPLRILLRNTAIDISEEAQRDIASFKEWASYGGIQTADGFQLVGEELDGHLDVSA